MYILQNIQTGSEAHPASCLVGTVAPSRLSSRGVKLTDHLPPVPGLRMSGTTSLLLLFAFLALTGTFLCRNMYRAQMVLIQTH